MSELIERNDSSHTLIIDRVESIMRLVQRENYLDIVVAFNKVEYDSNNVSKYLFYFDIEDAKGIQHEEKVVLNERLIESDLNEIYNILYHTFKKYN